MEPSGQACSKRAAVFTVSPPNTVGEHAYARCTGHHLAEVDAEADTGIAIGRPVVPLVDERPDIVGQGDHFLRMPFVGSGLPGNGMVGVTHGYDLPDPVDHGHAVECGEAGVQSPDEP